MRRISAFVVVLDEPINDDSPRAVDLHTALRALRSVATAHAVESIDRIAEHATESRIRLEVAGELRQMTLAMLKPADPA